MRAIIDCAARPTGSDDCGGWSATLPHSVREAVSVHPPEKYFFLRLITSSRRHEYRIGQQPVLVSLAEPLPWGAAVGRNRAEHHAVSSTSAIAPTPTGRRIRRLRWNYGQDNLRGVLCVQVDRVVRDLRAAVVVERFSGVWVDVEAGKVAA